MTGCVNGSTGRCHPRLARRSVVPSGSPSRLAHRTPRDDSARRLARALLDRPPEVRRAPLRGQRQRRRFDLQRRHLDAGACELLVAFLLPPVQSGSPDAVGGDARSAQCPVTPRLRRQRHPARDRRSRQAFFVCTADRAGSLIRRPSPCTAPRSSSEAAATCSRCRSCATAPSSARVRSWITGTNAWYQTLVAGPPPTGPLECRVLVDGNRR